MVSGYDKALTEADGAGAKARGTFGEEWPVE